MYLIQTTVGQARVPNHVMVLTNSFFLHVLDM